MQNNQNTRKRAQGRPRKWTLEKCKASALKYKTRTEWENGENKAWAAARRNEGWFDICCEHMGKPHSSRIIWTLETCKESAKPFKQRTRWAEANVGAYLAACDNDWIDECCEHMGPPLKPPRRGKRVRKDSESNGVKFRDPFSLIDKKAA